MELIVRVIGAFNEGLSPIITQDALLVGLGSWFIEQLYLIGIQTRNACLGIIQQRHGVFITTISKSIVVCLILLSNNGSAVELVRLFLLVEVWCQSLFTWWIKALFRKNVDLKFLCLIILQWVNHWLKQGWDHSVLCHGVLAWGCQSLGVLVVQLKNNHWFCFGSNVGVQVFCQQTYQVLVMVGQLSVGDT